jgi:hypothetical protein
MLSPILRVRFIILRHCEDWCIMRIEVRCFTVTLYVIMHNHTIHHESLTKKSGSAYLPSYCATVSLARNYFHPKRDKIFELLVPLSQLAGGKPLSSSSRLYMIISRFDKHWKCIISPFTYLNTPLLLLLSWPQKLVPPPHEPTCAAFCLVGTVALSCSFSKRNNRLSNTWQVFL